MSFSDETLIAYADGELDETTRRAVEEAMRLDDGVARRVAHYRALRDGQYAAQAPREGARARRGANVVQLDAVRASRAANHSAARRGRRRPWGWLEWSMLALMLLSGMVVGRFVLVRWQPSWFGPPAPVTVVAHHDGVLAAQGALASSLSLQMGGAATASSEVRIGLSFLSREGGYCRTFTLAGTGQELAGLACRASEEWRIPVLVQVGKPMPQMGAYKRAGVDLPTALLEAIDQRIVGEMLEPRAELEALRRGWQR
ncbi:anti-sigma factor family protein [Rugamonas apoptosis]|uniref:Anti-sigma factor n=1 Tax=Rugamonas apoptosis TaxID=2758570 RepID=A0A7W2ILC3_9BURK|nr:hypothetical protein [Rugamonas apoptosis]MBA5688291.1 hypothetical protein [Rugamonas apoptosis]